MIQDEVWVKKYQELMTFIETNHRSLSRRNSEERGLNHNWLKQNRVLINASQIYGEKGFVVETAEDG